LERSAISHLLPEWVERAFGVTDHPAKCSAPVEMVPEQNFDLRLTRPDIRFAAVAKEADDSLSLCVVLADNLIQFHTLKIPYRREPTIVAEHRLALNSQMLFTIVVGRLHVYDPVTLQFFRVHESEIQIETKTIETNLIVTVGQHLLVAASSSSLSFDGRIKYHTNCRMSAIAGSSTFRVIAYAGFDGWVHVLSLPRWKPVNKATLDGAIVSKLLITESNGLILAFTHQHFFVLSINGVVIRKVANDAEICCWTTFVSNAGIDYVIYVDAQNDVGWFEAMYPERKTTLFRFPDLVLLHYKKSAQIIVAVSKQGAVKFARFSSEIPVTLSPR
jgi:hypothetical protein